MYPLASWVGFGIFYFGLLFILEGWPLGLDTERPNQSKSGSLAAEVHPIAAYQNPTGPN